MTDPINFRALCAELHKALEPHAETLEEERLLDRSAAALRAALAEPVAEPPAVTERPSDEELGLIYHDCCRGCEFMDQVGFEDAARAVLARWGQPPAVAEQPSDEEWYALVERAWDKYETVGYQGERFMYDGDFGNALEFVRRELACWGQPPAPPAEGEVAELVHELRHFIAGYLQMRGLDPEHIYSIHRGHPMEANLRISRLKRIAELLERHAAPVPAETLAARPLIERVAAMGDCIGQQTVGQVMSLASRAAAWLAENPPGQPVAIEPRGCPTPGACSCMEPALAEPVAEPPAPPAEGEVAELARWLRNRNPIDMEGEPDDCTYFKLTRAAELLERHAAPVPVPVAERDTRDPECVKAWPDCWDGGYDPRCCRFPKSCSCGLPAHALPLPAPQGGEVE